MKRILVLMSVTAACVAGASANSLQLFFSETPGVPYLQWPPAITNPVVDTSAGPVTVYLWAQTNKVGSTWDAWQGLSLDLVGPTGESGFAYNPSDEETGSLRWEPLSRLAWTDTGGMYAVAVTARGLGPRDGPWPTSATTRFFPVAEITFQPGMYDVFLAIGGGGIARRGGAAADVVYFGAGDDGLHVNEFGRVSMVADLTIVPEPAGLVLLTAAGLLVRRRQKRSTLIAVRRGCTLLNPVPNLVGAARVLSI